jgi:hypothetical protein
LAVPAKQDVGWFDICEQSAIDTSSPGGPTSVNNLMTVEIGKTIEDSLCHLPQNLFSSPASKLLDLLINTVQAATFTKLHCNRDCTSALIDKSTIVSADELGSALFVKTKLSHDLFLDIWIGIGGDDLLED